MAIQSEKNGKANALHDIEFRISSHKLGFHDTVWLVLKFVGAEKKWNKKHLKKPSSNPIYSISNHK